VAENYVVEVEAARHAAVKRGVLAEPRGLTGSRYRSCFLGRAGTADWDDCTAAFIEPVLLNGPTFTTVVVSGYDAWTDAEAVLIATQMAACTSGGMPTAARVISRPGP
jgi:hypothetical protein